MPMLALAEEPKSKVETNCETFFKEDICNMSLEEQELFFLELLKNILEDTIEKKKSLDV